MSLPKTTVGWIAALSLGVLPALAQHTTRPAPTNAPPPPVSSASDPIPGLPMSPTDSISAIMQRESMEVSSPMDSIMQEDCGAWTQTGAKSATVSTVRLEVPGKARSAYQKVCGEFKKKKLADAERDAQKVITDYPKFPAAWVLLGESYYFEERMDPAKEACTQASTVDPTYVSSYLCLAAVADAQQDWSQTSDIAEKALGVSPLQNPYGLYFKADASYHMGDYKKAETLAKSALDADTQHELPDIEFLLARIYHAQENFTAAESQLKDYLKLQHQPNDPDSVKTLMASIKAAEISK
jgi:predicted Zn-dependent protease